MNKMSGTAISSITTPATPLQGAAKRTLRRIKS